MPKEKRPSIIVKKRDLLGKKVKKLRQDGQIPANLYGKKIKSLSIVLNTLAFEKLFRQAGETSLIDLTIEDEKAPRPVLISQVQFHPVTDHPLHVDFRQVDLTEKVIAHIPIHLIGESLAVKDKGGVLVTAIDEIEVEALPADLPEHIEIDIASLTEIGSNIHIKDLKISAKVEVKLNPEEVVLTVQEQKQKEEPTLVPAAAAAPAEGEPAAEGAAPAPAAAEKGEKPAAAPKPGAPTTKPPEPKKEVKK